MAQEDYVRARIDVETKVRAARVLSEIGLTVSDAIRLLMVRIAEEKRLPFEVRIPNQETREAMAELCENRAEIFATVDDLFADLNDDEQLP